MIQPITQAEHVPSDLTARYYLIQHTPDALRREKCNVGVVVEKGDARTARFIGQRGPDEAIDLRSAKRFEDANVYRMWVRHWEGAIESKDWQERMGIKECSAYSLLPAGQVSQTGLGTAQEVCAYLFGLLVSHGGLREALSEGEESKATGNIREDLRIELRKLKLMNSVAPDWCRHPVYAEQTIMGKSANHSVSFYQESQGEKWIIEPISLSTHQKRRTKERAGYLNFLLGDIQRNNSARKTNTLAVVGVHDEDRDDKSIRWAMDVVRQNADIVDWGNEDARKRFFNERDAVARTA